MAQENISAIASVLVVGGGIEGMAEANSLARRGVPVEDPDWRVHGASITIKGPTLHAYKHLGMVQEIAEKGPITDGSRVFRYDGCTSKTEANRQLRSAGCGAGRKQHFHMLQQGRIEGRPRCGGSTSPGRPVSARSKLSTPNTSSRSCSNSVARPL